MSGGEEAEDRTLRATRGGEASEPTEAPTQADDATRLAARGLDQTRVARRGPARESLERIEAPRFTDRAPGSREALAREAGDTYAPRTSGPERAGVVPAARDVEDAAADAPDIVSPEQREERARHDRWRRARRTAAVAIGAAAAIGAAVAVAVALL